MTKCWINVYVIDWQCALGRHCSQAWSSTVRVKHWWYRSMPLVDHWSQPSIFELVLQRRRGYSTAFILITILIVIKLLDTMLWLLSSHMIWCCLIINYLNSFESLFPHYPIILTKRSYCIAFECCGTLWKFYVWGRLFFDIMRSMWCSGPL